MAHTEPCGDSMAALHPAEDPRYGAEIFEATTFPAARGTRADARVLPLGHRGRLFAIFDHIGILGDVLAIKSEGLDRHLFHRGCPASIRSGRRPASTHQGFQGGRDHDLEIPFREHRVGIFPVEDLALLGYPNLARKIADGLGEDGRVSGATTAAYRAAAAVKEAQLYVRLTRRAVQLGLGLVQIPT